MEQSPTSTAAFSAAQAEMQACEPLESGFNSILEMPIRVRQQVELLPLPESPSARSSKGPSLRPFPLPLAWCDLDALLRRDADRSMYHDATRSAQSLPTPLRLYAGVSDPTWNRWPTLAGPYVCVSPVYGRQTGNRRESSVALNPETRVLLDSGAFSDACLAPKQGSLPQSRISHLECTRLTFGEALDRQYLHMRKYGYGDQVEAIASYEVLIDEYWLAGSMRGEWRRAKRRWSEQEALFAIEETVKAAAFLDAHRNGMRCVMNIQGVTPEQYLSCARRILPYVRQGDIVGLGGWCLTGRYPTYILPVFRATIRLLIPFLHAQRVARLHVWGVCYVPALGELLWLCDQYGIEMSTDSAMPALRPVLGEWGYAEWRDLQYALRRPPLHLPQEQYQRTPLKDVDVAEDPVLGMHFLLLQDEESAEEHREQEHLAWLYDGEMVELYWQDALDSLRSMAPWIYGQVKAHDGSFVRVVLAQGAHRIEHVHQVRLWLSHLHRTRWYRSPPV